MDQKTFSIVAGVIFTLVALFHLVRIYMGWPVDIGDWSTGLASSSPEASLFSGLDSRRTSHVGMTSGAMESDHARVRPKSVGALSS